MECTTKFYGIIVGHERISFVLDGFQCVFINSNVKVKTPEVIFCNQGFILGMTTKGEYVYIHSGKDLKVFTQITLNTGSYFVSERPNIETYTAISFRNGILNKLFFKSALEFEYNETTERIVKYQNDSLNYCLSNERIKGSITVRSRTQESMSLEKGNSIAIVGTEVELSFDNEKKIQTISEMFGYMLSMCRFMSFRRNVGFEEIILAEKSERIPGINEDIAKCYIRYDYIESTEKSIIMCITFNALGGCVDKLLDSIVSNKPKKPRFNIGFIPENDKDVNIITNMKIREVCSALESEMELAKITVHQEEKFYDLIRDLKMVVKRHRDGINSLTDPKIYDYILGTLDHLSGALADRIWECWVDCQPMIGEWIERTLIDKLVKYRNTITHGNYMQLDGELADSTDILMKLVYCCVLRRIGMNENLIKDLFKKKIIS